jgi:hypothetical protein
MRGQGTSGRKVCFKLAANRRGGKSAAVVVRQHLGDEMVAEGMQKRQT